MEKQAKQGRRTEDVLDKAIMVLLLPIFMAFDIWEGCERAWKTATYTWKEIKQGDWR